MTQQIDVKRSVLKHFLATLAYRTQKAVRGAPATYADFRIAASARTPHEIILHMTGVLLYALTFFGEEIDTWPDKLSSLDDEVGRFHETLKRLGKHLDTGTQLHDLTLERMLQGQLSDAMTHVGQLMMLRRLAGSPVLGENFIMAAIDPGNLGPDQPDPVSPDTRMYEPDE